MLSNSYIDEIFNMVQSISLLTVQFCFKTFKLNLPGQRTVFLCAPGSEPLVADCCPS